MSLDTFSKLRYAYPRHSIPTLKQLRARVVDLCGFQPVFFDCCIDSCICYAGKYSDLQCCPKPGCGKPRLDADGKPKKTFTYLPLIPCLAALATNAEFATKMDYRAEYVSTAGEIHDIFDGQHYRELLNKFVNINGKEYSFKYFSDHRDIALALATDGVGPFRNRRNQTCWPLLVFLLNLNPKWRTHLKNILSLGVIPGPKKPWEIESFLYPFISELLDLAIGIKSFDIRRQELFLQRAYLLLAFGDIPAVSAIMCIKGHNATYPCCFCKIQGIGDPEGQKTLYVPLS